MKKITPLFKYILLGLIILSCLIGINVAQATFHQYEIVVNGILSAIVIYTIFRFLLTLRLKGINGRISDFTLFNFPANIIMVVGMFFVSVVFYWALINIFHMISFLFTGK